MKAALSVSIKSTLSKRKRATLAFSLRTRAYVRTALTAPALAMSQKSGTCPDFWHILILREFPSNSLFLSKNIVFRQSERRTDFGSPFFKILMKRIHFQKPMRRCPKEALCRRISTWRWKRGGVSWQWGWCPHSV